MHELLSGERGEKPEFDLDDRDKDYTKLREKNLKKAKATKLYKHLDKDSPLLVSDVILCMANEMFNRIDPIIYGFEREAEALLELVNQASDAIRNRNRVRRAFTAKEDALMIGTELD